MGTKKEYKDCDLCGCCHINKVCECAEFSEGLRSLLKKARSFRIEKFKEKDRSISEALHIPYSGMGDPDYVHMSDFLKDDVHSLIIEFIDNNKITTIEELKEQIENIDDDSTLHEHISSSLTWQQGLIDSGKIIEYFSQYEEDDTGLWEGQQPEEAITSKAFWTYKSAVMVNINEFIEEFED